MTAIASPTEPVSRRARLVFGVAALGALALLSWIYGLAPGMRGPQTVSFFTEASIRCTHDLGWGIATSRCRAFGAPVGFPLLFGGPLVVLGALLMYVPGVDSMGALSAAGIVFTALALWGGYALMRKLGIGRWLALATASVYCLSPTLIGLQGFGGTFIGYSLLPAYAFVDLTVIDRCRSTRPRQLGLLLAAYAFVRTFSLFMDGYSFVASSLIASCLWLAWLVGRDRSGRERATGIALFIAASAIAYGIYSIYVPFDMPTNAISVFRALGLDLITLITPSKYIWWASLLGLADDREKLWGDGTNSMYNYVGFLGVALAIYAVVTLRRDPRVIALAAAGLIALVMSFGPALKFDAQFTKETERYEMPEAAGTELPWAPAPTATPGLESMRATYRWFGVTRLSLIVLAALALTCIARRGPSARLLAAIIGSLAVVEVLPTIPEFARAYRSSYDMRVQFDRDVTDPLAKSIAPGERIYFLPFDAGRNDFLANYLAAAAKVRTFNVGGDKNLYYSRQNWPRAISSVANTDPAATPDAVNHILVSGELDVVIAPRFHLQRNAMTWPPDPTILAVADNTFARILTDPRFEVKRTRWFATIRLRPGQSVITRSPRARTSSR